MAITINTNPSGLPSVHDGMWHVVSSDNSGTTDFKYVFDIWVNGVQKIRVKQFPEPSNGKGYFDAGPTVRNEMVYDWFEPLDSFLVDEPDMSGQIGVKYAIRVGEEVSGVTTTNMASGEVSGYNWTPNLFKRRVANLSDRLNKWLTGKPLTTSVGLGENLFIGFYSNVTLTPYVETYGINNNLLESANYSNLTSGFKQLNIGTEIVEADFGVNITSDVKYYDIWFNSLEKMRVYLKCNNKYTSIPIHFLNRWGMYDTHRFDLASRLEMNVKRKGFEQRDYRFSGNSVDYKSASNRYYEGQTNYHQAATWSYKLTSDALTDAEYEWLSDLIVSPQILLELDGYFYPVTIKQTTYEYGKYVNDRLKAFEIEFELNTTRYSQLR